MYNKCNLTINYSPTIVMFISRQYCMLSFVTFVLCACLPGASSMKSKEAKAEKSQIYRQRSKNIKAQNICLGEDDFQSSKQVKSELEKRDVFMNGYSDIQQ